MKKLTLIFLLALTFSCAKKENENEDLTVEEKSHVINDSLPERESVAVVDSTMLIVPGMQIGNTTLGENATTLASLGQPDLSDSAMGKSWMLWYSKKMNPNENLTELMISTGYKDSSMKEKVVKEIRITSADFKTPEGHGVGSTLLEVVEEFPDIRATLEYTNTKTGKQIQIFDDSISGIAFEFQKDKPKKCIAIIVHPIEKPSGNEYLALHPEFKSNTLQ